MADVKRQNEKFVQQFREVNAALKNAKKTDSALRGFFVAADVALQERQQQLDEYKTH